ncbi:MAG: DHH family phosphoesterase [Bacteroidales bacterium]|nr:DHH family phosphoesterase [Candidatus Cryptobacteroides caccocaballi]
MDTLDRQSLARLDELFGKATNTAIVTHVHPDGDALGSSFGLQHYLNSRGVASTVFVSDEVPETLRFVLEGAAEGQPIVAAEGLERAESLLASADLLVCLDFNNFSRADLLSSSLKSLSCPKVLIDHHLRPDRESFDLCFSDTQVSSASELLYHVLMEMPDVSGDASALPPHCARCLMTGMTTDTNNFANSTYPSTLEMASKLIAAGVDRDSILYGIYNNYREERYRLLGHLLSDVLTITPDGVAYMVLGEEDKRKFDVREGDTEAFVNMPLGIRGVRMSIFAKQQDESVYRISVRSEKGVSANVCAGNYFHGGGHENAAGGRLEIPADVTDPQSVATYIETVTRKFFNE